MKRILASAFAVITIVISLGVFVWSKSLLGPVSATSQVKYFSVARGATAAQITADLQAAGLLRSALATRLYLQLHRLDSRIKLGGYSLSPSLSTPQIVNLLTSGPKDIWVTLPEGWRKEQIAARLADSFSQFDPLAFLELTATLEGRLFPDTYLFPQDLTANSAVSFLLANFIQKSSLDLQDPAHHQALILASLLEREAAGSADLPVIAGILTKRLSAGWPLQVDASIQYARDTADCPVFSSNCRFWLPVSDTQLASRYNTYLHPGLPPGPIANPGRAAIAAALHPTASPYWYYLHAPDGTVFYAVTLAEHQAHIDKYLTP